MDKQDLQDDFRFDLQISDLEIILLILSIHVLSFARQAYHDSLLDSYELIWFCIFTNSATVVSIPSLD